MVNRWIAHPHFEQDLRQLAQKSGFETLSPQHIGLLRDWLKDAATTIIHQYNPDNHQSAPVPYFTGRLEYWARQYLKDIPAAPQKVKPPSSGGRTEKPSTESTSPTEVNLPSSFARGYLGLRSSDVLRPNETVSSSISSPELQRPSLLSRKLRALDTRHPLPANEDAVGIASSMTPNVSGPSLPALTSQKRQLTPAAYRAAVQRVRNEMDLQSARAARVHELLGQMRTQLDVADTPERRNQLEERYRRLNRVPTVALRRIGSMLRVVQPTIKLKRPRKTTMEKPLKVKPSPQTARVKKVKVEKAPVVLPELTDEEKLVQDGLNVVNYMVYKAVRMGYDPAETESAAMFGLAKAVKRFDSTQGAKFFTYVHPVIWGEILRAMRDSPTGRLKLPRRLGEKRKSYLEAYEALSQRLYREPTNDELAEHMKVTPEMVREVSETFVRGPLSSLQNEQEVQNSGKSSILENYLGEEQPEFGDEHAEHQDRIRQVAAAVNTPGLLKDSEKRVLNLYFLQNKPQSAIARELDLSQMHVSRLLGKAIEKIRGKLGVSNPGEQE